MRFVDRLYFFAIGMISGIMTVTIGGRPFTSFSVTDIMQFLKVFASVVVFAVAATVVYIVFFSKDEDDNKRQEII